MLKDSNFSAVWCIQTIIVEWALYYVHALKVALAKFPYVTWQSKW